MRKESYIKGYSEEIKKVRQLIVALRSEEQRYNDMANAVQDHQLRDSIRRVAQQHEHYASELQSQLYMIGAQLDSDAMNGDDPGEIIPSLSRERDTADRVLLNEVAVKDCCDNEKNMISLYRNLLNISLPQELHQVVRYQMDGIVSCFLQMKLVRTTLNDLQ